MPIWNDDKSPKQLLPIEFPKYKKDDPLPELKFNLKAEAKSINGKTCNVAGETAQLNDIVITPEMVLRSSNLTEHEPQT